MKKILAFTSIFLVLVLTACSSNSIGNKNTTTTVVISDSPVVEKLLLNEEDIPYQITAAQYSKGDININYPQIINMKDIEKQNTINSIIKKDALGEFTDETTGNSEDIQYEIKYKSPYLISIQFSGMSYTQGAAHPAKLFCTTNIDINKGIKLKLKEIVKIDGNLIDKFKKGKSTWGEQSQDGIAYTINNFSNKELIDNFDSADSDYMDTYSYFTKESLGISVSVCYAAGGHQEIEIEYKDIMNNIIKDSILGAELFNKLGLKDTSNNNKHDINRKKISVDEAKDLIGEYNLVELTTDELWNKMGAQIFGYNNDSIGYSYLIKDGKSKLLCSAVGDYYGIQNIFISDLDKNGEPELIFDYFYNAEKDIGPYYYSICAYKYGLEEIQTIKTAEVNDKYLIKAESDNKLLVYDWNHDSVDFKVEKIGDIVLTKENNETELSFKFISSK